MKNIGVLIVICGTVKVINTILGMINGNINTTYGGSAFIVLGAYLIFLSNKKKKNELDRKNWKENNIDNKM